MAGPEAIDLIFGFTSTDFTEACQQLHTQFPGVTQVATTTRTMHSATHNKLSATLWTPTGAWQSPTLSINPIIDRIGGGDAFIAGLLHGLSTGQDKQAALTFAVAASALKHTIEGDVNQVHLDKIEALVNGETSGRLKR